MSLDRKKFRNALSKAFIALVDSERGVASKLIKAVDESSSFISNVKRGRPVNAMHLKAVGIVFGPQKVLDLLSIDRIESSSHKDSEFKHKEKGELAIKSLLEMEELDRRTFFRMVTEIEDMAVTLQERKLSKQVLSKPKIDPDEDTFDENKYSGDKKTKPEPQKL